MAAGEVQANAREEFADTATNFEEAQPQRIELQRRVALRTQPAAQRING